MNQPQMDDPATLISEAQQIDPPAESTNSTPVESEILRLLESAQDLLERYKPETRTSSAKAWNVTLTDLEKIISHFTMRVIFSMCQPSLAGDQCRCKENCTCNKA